MMDESKTVALILAQLEPDDGIAIEIGPDVGEAPELTPEEQLHAVAGELVDAVHCGDVDAVVEALRGAFLLLDSMPHVEGEHVDEQAEEAEPEEESHGAEPVSHEVFERLGGFSEDNGYAYGGRGAYRMARGGSVQRYATGGRVRRYADGGSVEVEPDEETKTRAVRQLFEQAEKQRDEMMRAKEAREQDDSVRAAVDQQEIEDAERKRTATGNVAAKQRDQIARRAAAAAERKLVEENAAAKRGNNSAPPPWLRALLPAMAAGRPAVRASDYTAGVAEGALRRASTTDATAAITEAAERRAREAAMREMDNDSRRRAMRGR